MITIDLNPKATFDEPFNGKVTEIQTSNKKVYKTNYKEN